MVWQTVLLIAAFCHGQSLANEVENSHSQGLEVVTEYLPFFIETIVQEYSDSKSIDFEQLRNSSFFQKNLEYIKRKLPLVHPRRLPLEHRKSFFINIYNILVLDSITKLGKLPQSFKGNIEGFKNVYNIGNRKYNLSSIKHGILRGNSPDISTKKIYFEDEEGKLSVPRDPRVLAALYSSTKSGPFLNAFTSDTLEEKLEASMVVMCEQSVILKNHSFIIIDSVFEKYMSDFAPSEKKLLRWLSDCVEDTNKKIALYFSAVDNSLMKYSFEKFNTDLVTLERDPDEKKILVDLYIQSLCPDVSNFFTTQLEPSFEEIDQLMSLNIIVFGKAEVTPINDGEDFEFVCQNGPLECLGNKIMSCAVEYFPIHIQVPFLTCLLTSSSIAKAVKECGRKNGVPTLAIEECWKSREGAEILYANGIKTLELNPKLYIVPTIAVNKVYNSSTLRASTKRFSSFICIAYMDTYQETFGISTPSGCQVKLEVYIDSLNANVSKFFDQQLKPTWDNVGHSISLEIIPFGTTEIIEDDEANGDEDSPLRMKCPGGPLECYTNILLGCIAELLPAETQIKLFQCITGPGASSLRGKECANQESIEWTPIEECVDGPLGPKLVLMNKNKTQMLSPPIQSIPTITVNKVNNKTFTEWALNDLKALICDAFLMSSGDRQTPINLPKGCPVRVEVYLETLCPDTKRFFLKVFHPTWKKLHPLIDLHLIPFGKANVWLSDNGKDYEFECQHGPLECDGNKLMNCAVEYLPVNLQVEFFACLFESSSPSSAGKKCSEKLMLPWSTLRDCSTSREGSELLFQNGIRTMNLKPSLYFVPTITLNRYFDSQTLKDSLNNLSDQVCQVYQKPFMGKEKVLTPKGCKLMLEVYFISFSEDSMVFLLQQLIPLWKKLHNDIDLKLIPIGKLPENNHFHNETEFAESCREIPSCTADLTFACVTQYFDIEVQMELIQCSFESNNSLATSKSCTPKYQSSWSKISKCLRGPEGSGLLKQNQNRARKIRPSFYTAPTILVNGFYAKKELKEARSDLQRLICTSFYDPVTSKMWKPSNCPVTLEVFIESLCPDTKLFFLHQLQPTWHKLSSIMDLKIIPFGKASAKLINPETNEYEFKCQHGPLECYGNEVMSCVVHHYSVQDQVRMLACMFAKDYPAVEGKECAEELGLDWTPITGCIDRDGASLLYENGIKTQSVKPQIFFIPTVTVNEVYSKKIGRKALHNLLGLVCSTYLSRMDLDQMDEVIDGCKVPVKIFFRALDDGMKFFFSQQAEDFWRVFKRLVHIQFLPFKILPIQEASGECWRNNCYQMNFLACLTKNETTDLQMEFLACLMSQDVPEMGLKLCSKELKVNFKDLDACASSARSSSILQDNTESFLKLQRPSETLPLVMVRESFLHPDQELKYLTCKNFYGPIPKECKRE